jgi:hypothetical protein
MIFGVEKIVYKNFILGLIQTYLSIKELMILKMLFFSQVFPLQVCARKKPIRSTMFVSGDIKFLDDPLKNSVIHTALTVV